MNSRYQPGQKIFLTDGNKNLIKSTVLKYMEVSKSENQDLPFSNRSGCCDSEQKETDEIVV